mgnify:CR=1 FL=1
MPGTFAAPDELLGIAEAMAAVGHGVFQFAPEHVDLLDEWGWMRAIALKTGVRHPVHFRVLLEPLRQRERVAAMPLHP